MDIREPTEGNKKHCSDEVDRVFAFTPEEATLLAFAALSRSENRRQQALSPLKYDTSLVNSVIPLQPLLFTGSDVSAKVYELLLRQYAEKLRLDTILPKEAVERRINDVERLITEIGQSTLIFAAMRSNDFDTFFVDNMGIDRVTDEDVKDE